jgi:formylglycine-generating enzyme required for sulfatase activity
VDAFRATTGGEKEGGKGHNGGVWEWTSTVFDKYEGFVPSVLYPGCVLCSFSARTTHLMYGMDRVSADFFDEVHNVVVSASKNNSVLCVLMLECRLAVLTL